MLGLVIQGPIMSHGLSGRTAGKGKTRVDESRFVSFNSETSLLRILEVGESLFDEIVVSTWEKEDTDFISKQFDSVKIVKSQDPGTILPGYRKPLTNLPFVHEINTLRQFTSTFNGLNVLNSQNILYAVKIRTDQDMNLSLLRNSLATLVESKKPFMAPFFNRNVPFAIPDFFLAGKLTEFRKLCELMMSKVFILHPNVHRDLALKSLVLHTNLLGNIRLIDIFYRNDKPSEALRPYLKHIPEIWQTGSKELFESIVWRGERFSSLPTYTCFEPTINLFEQNHPGRGQKDYKSFLTVSTGHKSALFLLFNKSRQTFSQAYQSMRRTLSYLRHKSLFH